MIKTLFTLFAILNLSIATAQYTDSITIQKINNEKAHGALHYAGYAIPVGMIAYGFLGLDEDGGVKQLNLSTRTEVKEDHPRFRNRTDDILQFSPYAATYILKAAGVKGTRSYKDQTFVTLISSAITTAAVFSIKNITHSQRPDGTSYNSFPSGHAANAFTGAELMRQQFSNQPIWLRYSGYGLASATGAMRVYNNRHWVSDVVAGAAIGILSAKAGDFIYKKLQRKKGHGLAAALD